MVTKVLGSGGSGEGEKLPSKGRELGTGEGGKGLLLWMSS